MANVESEQKEQHTHLTVDMFDISHHRGSQVSSSRKLDGIAPVRSSPYRCSSTCCGMRIRRMSARAHTPWQGASATARGAGQSAQVLRQRKAFNQTHALSSPSACSAQQLHSPGKKSRSPSASSVPSVSGTASQRGIRSPRRFIHCRPPASATTRGPCTEKNAAQ